MNVRLATGLIVLGLIMIPWALAQNVLGLGLVDFPKQSAWERFWRVFPPVSAFFLGVIFMIFGFAYNFIWG